MLKRIECAFVITGLAANDAEEVVGLDASGVEAQIRNRGGLGLADLALFEKHLHLRKFGRLRCPIRILVRCSAFVRVNWNRAPCERKEQEGERSSRKLNRSRHLVCLPHCSILSACWAIACWGCWRKSSSRISRAWPLLFSRT